jgi:glycosyltransferase involved in cell wall biosynthesis
MGSRAGAGCAMSVAVVVSGWPRVSETFALNELLALDRAGALAGVFATKAGDRSLRQPGTDGLDVTVLPDGSIEEQAAQIVRSLAGRRVTGVHGYFAHRPAAVAERAAARLGVPFGFSAHALDVRKVAPTELAGRVRGARVVVACNADVAASLRDAGAVPSLVGHGVDVRRFRPRRCGPTDVLRLLAVGRFVPKKGFDVLLDALGRVDSPWQLDVVGDGPEREALHRLAVPLGDRVRWRGRVTHARLPAIFAAADAVVVPSRVDASADRDGLPNVVLEAMASGRPVVACDVAAIATAVDDGITGLLVGPDDPAALAAAIERLAGDQVLRSRLGVQARAAAELDHDLGSCTAALVRTLEWAYG